MENIIIYALVLVIIIQNITHRIERKELYNRIMAKSLPEYKNVPTKPVKNIIAKNFAQKQ